MPGNEHEIFVEARRALGTIVDARDKIDAHGTVTCLAVAMQGVQGTRKEPKCQISYTRSSWTAWPS